jgi:molybdenum cofactor biosynthesis protein B
VTGRRLVSNDDVDLELANLLSDAEVQVLITTGGTGVSERDATYEAVSDVIEKRLDGFGELFRMLSYQDIGPAAMLSRATAGVTEKKVIIALPGSVAAVRLAMTRLVIPELGHLVQQASR